MAHKTHHSQIKGRKSKLKIKSMLICSFFISEIWCTKNLYPKKRLTIKFSSEKYENTCRKEFLMSVQTLLTPDCCIMIIPFIILCCLLESSWPQRIFQWFCSLRTFQLPLQMSGVSSTRFFRAVRVKLDERQCMLGSVCALGYLFINWGSIDTKEWRRGKRSVCVAPRRVGALRQRLSDPTAI